MEKKKKSIAINYIYNLLYQLLTIALPLVTTPYLSRVLGVKNIGIYGYTTSIVAYFILLGSLGIATYGQREIAYRQNDKKAQSKFFWEIIIVRAITVIISMIVFYFIFVISNEYSVYYKILLLLIFASMFDISWLFQGIEEFDKTVVRNLVVKTLSLILIFVCVKAEADLWKYFLIYVLSELIGNISIWMYVPKYLEKVKVNKLEFKKHIKPTLLLFFPQIAIQIYTVLDKTMIGLITHDMSEVGYYEQAQKIVRAALIIVTAVGTVMSSRIANEYAKKKHEEIEKCLEKSFDFVWFLSLPMMFGLIAISSKFVPLFYGQGFDRVIPIIALSSPILLVVGLSNITGNQYLIQVGNQKVFTISVIFGAIANSVMNFILISNFGAVGATIASVLAEIVILIYQLHYFKKDFKIFKFFTSSIKCIISGLIMFIGVYILASKLEMSIINTIIEIIVGGIIYIGMLLILKYNFIYDLINQLLSGVKDKIKGE